ncbi:MAG: anaerobic ribonucleoside-triphosphate reductase activating protein [Thermoguttaceae bacterium]|nr:anaerobic ribonucleoside-triphosphate reductase activating protein [Thermoguttaceae bacterium]
MKLRVAGFAQDSIVDGPGLRYVVFTQGCPRSCPGCHNPQTHDPNGGEETTTEAVFTQIASNPLLDGVTISGGEPFMQAVAVADLVQKIQKLGLTVGVYTGYTWEELMGANNPAWNALLAGIDFLVDGPYIQEKRDWALKFAGSSNQRYIDVKKSLAAGELAVITEF